jgi:hypothetical protein
LLLSDQRRGGAAEKHMRGQPRRQAHRRVAQLGLTAVPWQLAGADPVQGRPVERAPGAGESAPVQIHVYAGAKRRLSDYLSSGQILIGCEGNDESLGYLAKIIGVEAFAYSSDYPHEVDLPGATMQIQETCQRSDLSESDKRAVLGESARRFFRLPRLATAAA